MKIIQEKTALQIATVMIITINIINTTKTIKIIINTMKDIIINTVMSINIIIIIRSIKITRPNRITSQDIIMEPIFMEITI